MSKAAIDHLVMCICTACPRQCTGCQKFAPVIPAVTVSVARIKRDLACVRSLADVKNVVLTGGDPLMHPELLAALEACKEALPKTRIVLHSPFDLLANLVKEHWRLVDAVWVMMPEGIPMPFEAELRSWCHVVSCKPCPCTKVVTSVRRAADDTAAMWAECPERGQTPLLHDGRLYWCRKHCYMQLAGATKDYSGLRIEDATQEQLGGFLQPVRPAEECRRCAGPKAVGLPWCEIDVDHGPGRFQWWAEATDMSSSPRSVAPRNAPQRNDQGGRDEGE